MRIPKAFNRDAGKKLRVVAEYEYTDQAGRFLYVKTRDEQKGFAFFHMAENRHWKSGRNGPGVLYNLKALAEAPPERPVFWVEGEKDVDTLKARGLLAVTNDDGGGKGKFRPNFSRQLMGRRVYILRDNDDRGEEMAAEVHQALQGIAASAVRVELPRVGHKEDVTDWLERRGGSVEELLRLAEAAEVAATCGTAVVADELPDDQRGDAWEPPASDDEVYDDDGDGWQPFPLECLPSVVARYVSEAAESMQIEPAMVALPVLPVLGGVIGNSRVLPVKGDWPEPSVIWAALVAEPSSLKTPAMRKATGPLYDIQRRLIDEDKAAQMKHRRDVYEFVERLSGEGKRNPTKEHPDYPEEPTPQQLIVQDTTVEALVEILYGNPNGLILCTDELSSWLGSFARYQQGTKPSPDEAFWLQATTAGSHMYNRKSRDRKMLYVNRCTVSVYGTIQPEVLKRFASKQFFESGFAARILFAMPPRRKRRWSEQNISPEILSAYSELVENIWFVSRARLLASDLAPTPMRMTAQAKKRWVSFYDDWQEVQEKAEGFKQYNLGKLEGYCARFAMIFAVAEAAERQSDKEEVSASNMEAAVKLTHWFAHETERVYQRLHKSEHAVERDRTLQLIAARGGRISPRELYLSNKAKYHDTDGARAVLEGYVVKELGTWEVDFAKVGPGRKPRYFALKTNKIKTNRMR